MPKTKKVALTPAEMVRIINDLKKENEELKTDNIILTNIGKSLRAFNKDLVTDNIDSAQTIQRLERELGGLQAEKEYLEAQVSTNKSRIIEWICIFGICLVGACLILLGK